MDDVTSEIAEMYLTKTRHITPSRAKFFRHWERLLSLEEDHVYQQQQEIWTISANDQEQARRAITSLRIVSSSPRSGGRTGGGAEGRVYQFKRSPAPDPAHDDISVLCASTRFREGDMVILSMDPNFICLARGRVVEIGREGIKVKTHRPISEEHRKAGESFRIDQDHSFVGISQMRVNLANLFFADGDTKRLELIVDRRRPRVRSSAPVDMFEHQHLNANQSNAINRAIHALDYNIIQGVPGAGKTTVIVGLVKTLVKAGRSVLLSTYTHSALDNILKKLLDSGVIFLRLGDTHKVRGRDGEEFMQEPDALLKDRSCYQSKHAAACHRQIVLGRL